MKKVAGETVIRDKVDGITVILNLVPPLIRHELLIFANSMNLDRIATTSIDTITIKKTTIGTFLFTLGHLFYSESIKPIVKYYMFLRYEEVFLLSVFEYTVKPLLSGHAL